MSELLVVFSDTHCGSRLGLMPEEYTIIEDDVTIKASATQKWLLQAWEALWTDVKNYIGKESWSVAIVGDAIEGCHHGRKELVSHDIADHIEIFMKVVEPKIRAAEKKYFVLGTSAHGGDTHEMGIAKRVGAVKKNGRYADNRWCLDLNGYPLVLRHHINATSREYLRGSALSINLANEQLAAIKRGHKAPKGLIAAHRHMYDYYTDNENFCLVCGPWQMTTRYGHQQWSPMTPEPTLSILDWRETSKGAMPVLQTFKATTEEPKYVKA